MKQKSKAALIGGAVLGLLLCCAGCARSDSGAWAAKAPFYKIVQSQAGDYQDHRTDWENATKAQEIFLELEQTCGAFICSTWNYDLLDGKRRYELRADTEIPVAYDYYGQSITVSAHYFDETPIQDITGADVCTLLHHEADIIDILVPEHARGDEDMLVSLYQEYMLFNNVEVDNIYREVLGQAPNEKQAADFSVNVIYVPEHTSYTVYDPAIACDTIEDCLVIVVGAENFHRVQLNALLTQGFYLRADNDMQSAVQRVYAAHDYAAGLHSLQSVPALYSAWRRDAALTGVIIARLVFAGAACLAGGVLFIAQRRRRR